MISKELFLKYTVNQSTNRLYDKRVFKHHDNELNEFINCYYPGKDIKEVAYILYYNIQSIPKCKYCGKELVFHDFIHGYREYCDKSCAAKDSNPEQICEDKIITKEHIINTFTNKDTGEYIEQRCVTAYLKKNGWYNPLMKYYDDTESCFETIYRVINDLDIRPVCKQCGGKLEFKYGFNSFCSRVCSNKNLEVIEKISNGVSQSLLERYELDGDGIKEKRKNTLKNNFGIDGYSPFDSSLFRKKAVDTILNRYGVTNVLTLEENKEKSKDANRQRSVMLRQLQGYDIQYVEIDGETKILLKNGCEIHGDLILDPKMFNNRTKVERRDYTTICPICNPLRNPETSIETQIKKLLNDFNVQYEQHNRKCIAPYELDFYIPDYNLAIECNGIYWHSGENSGKRLLDKQKMCKDARIRLLYFWENDIHDKSNIIKSYLGSIFGKNNKVFARKCVVKEIDSKTSKSFISENHLQGNINASVRLGLFYNDNLVQVMTFGKLRKSLGSKSEENTYELYRLCSKGGITAIGGASKLLKFFIMNYKPKKIITYCSNDISNGNVYEKIGFKFVKECGSGYCYINVRTGERKNRFSLRKNIVDDGSGRSETEINQSNGWLKCYDTGNKKYDMEIIYK